jgi:hypothetical protein
MNNSAALVTIAIGNEYLESWRKYSEPGWRRYAEKYHYDIICIDKPLDNSERARKRSPAWQKCLVLSHDFSSRYQRIVWVDADILINERATPDILKYASPEKVGAVEEFSYSHQAGTLPRQLLDRAYKYWENAVINYTAREFYTNWGLAGFDSVVQTGVLVFSPQHHRELLEKVYYKYEEKGGAEWNYEMRPLSYELMKAGVVQWMDPRFNHMWPYSLFLYYPFLVEERNTANLVGRLHRRFARLVGARSLKDVRRKCLTATFCSSYFFHLGGSLFNKDAALVNTQVPHSRICTCDSDRDAAAG